MDDIKLFISKHRNLITIILGSILFTAAAHLLFYFGYLNNIPMIIIFTLLILSVLVIVKLIRDMAAVIRFAIIINGGYPYKVKRVKVK